jgi:hypothetical protein
MITKEILDEIQAAYDAGNRADNKMTIYFNYNIIVGEETYGPFYDLVETAAIAMEKNVQSILSSMYYTDNFYDKVSIFNQEFGSRITLLPGAENL